MTAPYGSIPAVQDLLSSDGTTEAWSESQQSRMLALLETIGGLIEEATGCRFGSETPETIEVNGQGDDTLFLDKGIRSVSSIVENPTTWTGSAWTGGTAFATTDYRLSGKEVQRIDGDTDSTVYHKLLRVDGVWSGLYVITGVWEDRVANVPDDIHYLANYVAAEVFKVQKASPAGFVGPDGAVVPVRDVFRSSEFRRIIDRWAVGRVAMVV